MIEGVAAFREAYREQGVVSRYRDERFREPLGALLHARQRAALTRCLPGDRPVRLLEIAPGPGRLTVHLARLGHRGTVIDASAGMLGAARKALTGRGARGWRFVNGDAFSLPLASTFDAVVVFRFLRHFEDADRARLYREIARVLRPGGLLVFDAVNRVVSAPLRARAAPGEYAHYDALQAPDEIRRELSEAGFEEIRMEGVQYRHPALLRLQVLAAPRSRWLARAAMELVDRMPGGQPLEWIVTCRRG